MHWTSSTTASLELPLQFAALSAFPPAIRGNCVPLQQSAGTKVTLAPCEALERHLAKEVRPAKHARRVDLRDSKLKLHSRYHSMWSGCVSLKSLIPISKSSSCSRCSSEFMPKSSRKHDRITWPVPSRGEVWQWPRAELFHREPVSRTTG